MTGFHCTTWLLIVSFSFFCSGAEFSQVSGLAVTVSLLFAIAGF